MIKRLTAILITSLLLVIGTAPASMAAEKGVTGDGYNYVIHVYSGNQGTFKGQKEWSTECKPGESVTISIKDCKVDNGSKYYVRGFRVAGHDNDETSGFVNMTFYANTDVSYEVAYGIKGSLVAYTIRYVDENGVELQPSDTYYGMPGDKPVASYRYIEGYTTDAYYKGKTLTGNPEDNVFTFVYSKGNGGQQGDGDGNGDGNGAGGDGNGPAGNGAAGGNGAGAVNAAAGPAAPGTTGNPAGTNTTTIGDNDTPLGVSPDYDDLDESEKGTNWTLIGIISAVAALVIAAFILLLIKRRRDSEDEADIDPTDV